nr:unnamed protein product [Haemonchus contortus]
MALSHLGNNSFRHYCRHGPFLASIHRFSTTPSLSVKIYPNAKEAVQDIPDNAKLLVGGSGTMDPSLKAPFAMI